MSFPTYRKNKNSHSLLIKRWHLYFFWKTKTPEGYQSGVTLKHQLQAEPEQIWRISTIKFQLLHHEGYETIVRQVDFDSYIARDFKGARIKKTKRYFRFRMCT